MSTSTNTTSPGDPSTGSPTTNELSKQYRPSEHEERIWSNWVAAKAFHANPDRVLKGEAKPYAIVIPPPNVTDRLHLGHALNNSLQDILTRAHRMMGYETLWMPGTDHAGIATQAVVEKRLRASGELKGPLRESMTRDAFVAKAQAFKDEYEAVILGQLKRMGCSCDWDRTRFTMDEVCARAVREAFFIMFKDGLIYRGKRLVNWDPALQTAVADDECFDEELDGFFYFLKYPIVGSNETITVATTRPETYLGDTAVALNPRDPRAASLVGKKVRLPLVGREIPIIADPYAVLPEAMATTDEERNDPKAKFSTGFVKMTPAHDNNDYQIGLAHGLPMINMMSPDGKVSDKHGWTDVGEAGEFVGLTMAEARVKVVAKFKALGLFEAQKPHRHSVKHSDRSKAVIEPYLSDQWYVKVTDPRLAQSANEALAGEQRSSTSPRAWHLAPFYGPDDEPAVIQSKLQHAKQATERLFAAFGFGVDVRFRNSNDASHWLDLFPAPEANMAEIAKLMDMAASPLGDDRNAVVKAINALPFRVPNAETLADAISDFNGLFESRAANVAGFEPPSNGSLRFFPARYSKTYEQWHDNIRDWCISRQLWWGHRVPVWFFKLNADEAHAAATRNVAACAEQDRAPKNGVGEILSSAMPVSNGQDLARFELGDFFDHLGIAIGLNLKIAFGPSSPDGQYVCCGDELAASAVNLLQDCRQIKDEKAIERKLVDFVRSVKHQPACDDPVIYDMSIRFAVTEALEVASLFEPAVQDSDVLDTWFSSALWPMSTMHWPDNSPLLRAFNPSTTLCTAREIITLWVSRMVMFNRYLRGSELGENEAGRGSGPLPFKNVFIHAVIQDGHGQKMSKSLGNGVDPLDIISSHGADAMRFTLCHMTTQTQDVRMPVDLVCPHTGEVFAPKMITNKDGYTVAAPIQDSPKDKTKKMVTVYGVASGEAKASAEMPLAKTTSGKFDLGRNFANKLWNASRFTLGILASSSPTPSRGAGGPPASTPFTSSLIDRWLLSRLATAVSEVNASLTSFEFSSYATTMYDLLWRDFCDWYLEGIKPTVANDAHQRAVLANALESILRLLHPVMPFVTEAIWEKVRDLKSAPVAGITLTPARNNGLLATAGWPIVAESLKDAKAEAEFERVRSLVTSIRDVRAQHQVLPRRKVTLHIPAGFTLDADANALSSTFANLEVITKDAPKAEAASTGVVAFSFDGLQFHLSNLRDAAAAGASNDAEKARLTKLVADLTKSVATLEGRLNNPGYADKAPPHMVQQSRDQLAKAKAELATAQATLGTLA